MSSKVFKHSGAYAKALCGLAFLMFCTPGYAQQIVPDGNTQTTLTTIGDVTDITTGTIVNSNAFNSFSEFFVGNGKTVNLQVPDNAARLINISKSDMWILGNLNSIQHGIPGGNIYLVSPSLHIMENAVLNVGALTAVTPTQTFINNFFTSPGVPDAASVNALLDGTCEIGPGSIIWNRGVINVAGDLELNSSNMNSIGKVYTDAVFNQDIMGAVVNINTLDNALNRNPANLTLQNGKVTFNAKGTIVLDGLIVAGNDLEFNAGNQILTFQHDNYTYTATGNINFNAAGGIFLENSKINSGGDININVQDRDFYNGLVIDSSAIFAPDNINIHAPRVRIGLTSSAIYPNIISAGNNVNIETSSQYFDSNFNMFNGDISGQNSVSIKTQEINPEGNNINIGALVDNGQIQDVDGYTQISSNGPVAISSGGDVNVAGNGTFKGDSIVITSNNLNIQPADGKSYSIKANSFDANIQNTVNIRNCDFKVKNDLTLNASEKIRISGDSFIHSVEGSLNIGQNTTPQSIEIFGYLKENYPAGPYYPVLEAEQNLNLIAIKDVIATGQSSLVSAGGINIVSDTVTLGYTPPGDTYPHHASIPDGMTMTANTIAINPVNNLRLQGADITATTSLQLNSGDIDNFGIMFTPEIIETPILITDFLTPGADLNLTSTNSSVYAGNLTNIFIDGIQVTYPNITIEGTTVIVDKLLSTTGNINISGDKIITKAGSNLIADNIVVDPGQTLFLSGGNFIASNNLSIFSGQIANNDLGIIFTPDSIQANTLTSDFLGVNNPLIFNFPDADLAEVALGNLDHIMIGNGLLNPTAITINLSPTTTARLTGDITTAGDLTVNAGTIFLEDTTNLNAANITINPVNYLMFRKVSINVNDTLNLSGGNINHNGITFTPESIQANIINSDFFADGTNFNLQANKSLIIGNLDKITAGENLVQFGNILLNSPYIIFTGENTVAGDIVLQGSKIHLNNTLIANAANISVDATDFLKLDGSTLNANNQTTFNTGDLKTTDKGLYFVPESISTQVLQSNFLPQNGGDINIESNGDVVLGNLSHIIVAGNNYTPAKIDLFVNNFITLQGDILTTGNITLGSNTNTTLAGNIESGGSLSVRLGGFNSILLVQNGSVIKSKDNIVLNDISPYDALYGKAVILDNSEITSTNGDLNIDFRDIYIGEGVNLFANNITSNADRNFIIDTATELHANKDITLNSGLSFSDGFETSDGVSIISDTGSVKIDGHKMPVFIAENNNIQAADLVNLNSSQALQIDEGTIIHSGNEVNISQIASQYSSYWDTMLYILEHSNISATNRVSLNSSNYFILNGSIQSDKNITVNNYQGNITTFYNPYGGNFILLSAPEIDITAQYGIIADNGFPITTDLIGDNQSLKVWSYGDMHLLEHTGNMVVSSAISQTGNIMLESNLGITGGPLIGLGAVHISGNDVSLYGDNDGTIGAENSTLRIKLNNNGALTAITPGLINITAPYGNLNLLEINSISGNDVTLNASNNILSANPDVQLISGGNITLDPYISGSIGTFDTPIRINTTNGVLFARSNDGYINIVETEDDLIIDLVSNNGKADVKLSAPNGGIIGVESENTHILAHSLELYADIGANNTIGTEDQALHINTNADGTTDGTLTALAGGLITIKEMIGDLNLNVVSNAGNDDVVLIAERSILSPFPLESNHINIYGNNIALAALTGSIGQDEVNYINLALNNNLLGGVLNAIAESDILVYQQINCSNLAVDEVISNTGSVALVSNASIIDAHDGPDVNVNGENVTLLALSGSIGTYDKDFDIRLNGGSLLAKSTGYINLHTPEGDMVIDGISNSGNSDIKLASAGNILHSITNNDHIIDSKNIYLYAPNGNIGLLTGWDYYGIDGIPLEINTNNEGILTAIANGSIFIYDNDSDLRIDVISNAGKNDVILMADSSILDGSPWTQDSVRQPNIYGNNIILSSGTGSIGTIQDSIDLALNNNLLGGSLFAYSDKDINLTQMLNGVNMTVGRIRSYHGDVKLSSNSGIIDGLDIDPGVATNITANNITLIATNNSSIGTFDNDLDIKLNNNGMLTAFGYGYINIGAEGNLKLDVVSNAGRADVQLHASGNIIPNDDLITPEIISRGLTLISDLGNIGIIDNLGYNTLDFDTNYAGGNGAVTALAQGYIEIYETNGNMLVNAISNAGRDEVFVWAKDSILDGSVLEQANIYGKDIIIESETGSIGTAADKVDVYTNYNNWGGVLDAYTPEGSLYINQIAKNLYLGEIEASNIAAISATAGGIYTYTGYPEINITSAKLFMESPVAIGNQFKPVVVDVSGPIGAGSPSVYIRNVH